MNLQSQFEKITDALAGKGYAIIDHFLSRHEVVDILQSDEFKNSKLHFKKAGIGKLRNLQINKSIRGDYIQWIDPADTPKPIADYFERLYKLIPHLNQNLFLSLKSVEVHMTVYPVGTYYKRHLDQFKSDDHRKLSIICYLNPGWREEHGGQLRIYLPDVPLYVLHLSGWLVCFCSCHVVH